MSFKLQFVTIATDSNSRQVLETLVLDASLSEVHSSDADVTEFPVEEGSDITDNVRILPHDLQVEAIISDFHLANRAGKAGWYAEGTSQDISAKSTLAKLEDYQSKGTLIDVETGLKSYRNMVIKSIRTPRDKNIFTGNDKRDSAKAGAIKVTMILKSIIIVQSQSVVIKQSVPKGQPVTPKGQKPSTSSDAGKENQSLLIKSQDVPATLKKIFDEGAARLFGG